MVLIRTPRTFLSMEQWTDWRGRFRQSIPLAREIRIQQGWCHRTHKQVSLLKAAHRALYEFELNRLDIGETGPHLKVPLLTDVADVVSGIVHHSSNLSLATIPCESAPLTSRVPPWNGLTRLSGTSTD